MKQLLQYLKDGKTMIVDVPVPQVRTGMVLVRTAASLVSAGTERMVVEFAEKNLLAKAQSRPDLVRQVLDKARREGFLQTLQATYNRLDQPMPLGYSSAGTIIAVGAGVRGFQVNDRVACAGGGYAVHAEYGVIPQNLVTLLPPQVDFESAAFTTLGAIALHGFRLASPQVGEHVAIIGLGLLGLLAVGIAQSAGCRVFGTDLDPSRVSLARQMGANASPRPEAEAAGRVLTDGRGFDVVLIGADTRANDPIELAGQLACDRGRVVALGAVGLSIPRKLYYEKELSFQVSRSYGPGRYDPTYEEGGQDYPYGYVRWTEGRNFSAVVNLMAGRHLNVKPLISHRFSISDAPAAYEIITGKRKESFLGVLLTYPESETADITTAKRIDLQPQHANRNTGLPGLGIFGAGNYAQAVFLPSVKKTGQVIAVGIASASGVSAQNTAKRYGFSYATSSEEEILNDAQIQIVAILTRHQSHAHLVRSSLLAGKHVFCEKPLAIKVEELDEIAEALKNAPASILSVGFNRRFAPLAIQMKDFLPQNEALMMTYRVNAGYLPLTHWLHDPAVGGGRILGEACHFIDFFTYLVGTPPIQVSARGLPDGQRYRQDNVLLTFVFADGSLGSLTYLANGDKSFPKERIEVFSAGRVAVLDDFRSLELTGDGRKKTIRSPLGQDKGHQALWQDFLNSVQKGGPEPIPYSHLWGVTQAAFCAHQSLTTGETLSIPAILFS